MAEVQFDINEVVQKLGAKIGELEAQLAFERSMSQAYVRRVEELEAELNEGVEGAE